MDFADVVGCSATVRIGLPEDSNSGTYPDPAYVSFFNGIISDIALQQSGAYTCTLRPALWRLTLVNDYRQFSQMTIKEIIEDIVGTKWGLPYDTDGLGTLATYRTQDWMQMGESDWDFIQKLLHEVSGFFYFVHDDVSHKVVFANNPGRTTNYINIPASGSTDRSTPMPVFYTFSAQDSLAEDDYLKSFSYEQKLVAPGTANILAEPQSAWEENAPADLHVYTDGQDGDKLFQHYRLFQYGSTQDLTTTLNKEDSWSVESQAFRLTGECTSARFKPGHVFETRQTKSQCNRDDVCLMRPELDGQRFVILNVSHQANVDGSYTNHFTAALASGNVVELATQATHIGSMVGRVVSKDDQRSNYRNHWMLNKGRPNFDPEVKTFYSGDGTPFTAQGVYVEFPGLNVSDEPIWIKLSETMMTIPEAGVVVLVDRSRDDTDVPQVAMIYEQKGSKNIMPNGMAENTRVGDEYATSYGDSRNISYGAQSSVNLDQAITQIDGEYASGDFKSASYSIGGSYSYSASDDGIAGVLSKSYSEGNTFHESYANQTTSYSEIGSTEDTSKIGSSVRNSDIGSSEDTSTIGTSVRHSTIGKNEDHSKIDTSINHSDIGSSQDSSKIGTSVRTSTIGAVTDSSAIGASNSNSVTGVSNANHATGVVVNRDLTGVSTTTSVAGVNNANSAIGSHIKLDAVGLAVDVSVIGASFKSVDLSADMSIEFENGVRVEQKGAKLEAKLQGLKTRILSALDIKM
jgi:type VI secretion system secreted protein VgrG